MAGWGDRHSLRLKSITLPSPRFQGIPLFSSLLSHFINETRRRRKKEIASYKLLGHFLLSSESLFLDKAEELHGINDASSKVSLIKDTNKILNLLNMHPKKFDTCLCICFHLHIKINLVLIRNSTAKV